jgi:aryl-alcohol dehydrogenase-like predicted oxidoreductase
MGLTEKAEAQKVYETYREAGGNFIDTANFYCASPELRAPLK